MMLQFSIRYAVVPKFWDSFLEYCFKAIFEKNKIKEIFDPYLAADPQGRKNPFGFIRSI